MKNLLYVILLGASVGGNLLFISGKCFGQFPTPNFPHNLCYCPSSKFSYMDTGFVLPIRIDTAKLFYKDTSAWIIHGTRLPEKCLGRQADQKTT